MWELRLIKEGMEAAVRHHQASVKMDLEIFQVRPVLRECLVDGVIQISALGNLYPGMRIPATQAFVEHEMSQVG